STSCTGARPTMRAPRRTRPPRRRGRRPPAGGRRLLGAGDTDGPAADAEVQPHQLVRFAHNSERQFAKLLDFYGIAWEYEPTEFTLEWSRSGEATQAFRPDFYLPAYDLYIEITTLNQKLVTKKNRKVRRLRELHPEVQV